MGDMPSRNVLPDLFYEQSGVREYWIVDPDAARIETWILKEGKFVDNGSVKADLAPAMLPEISIPISKIIRQGRD